MSMNEEDRLAVCEPGFNEGGGLMFAVGDTVALTMPCMTKPEQVGKIQSVANWFHGELRYEVSGEKFITIARADQLQPVVNRAV